MGFRNIQEKLEKNAHSIKTPNHCGNPMTSKMVDWKIQTDFTRVKTIQYDAVVGVLDWFYKSDEVWIFNPTFLKPLD